MSNKKKGSNVWRNLTPNLKIGTPFKESSQVMESKNTLENLRIFNVQLISRESII